MNPGGFDYERWLFTEGIGATGYVRPDPKPVLLGRDSVWRSIAVLRQSITDQLSIALGDSPSLALIKALTIGDGNSITQQQWEVFRKTGTTHLVVISGSHIGLIAGLVYFLVLKLWARTGWLSLVAAKGCGGFGRIGCDFLFGAGRIFRAYPTFGGHADCRDDGHHSAT